MRLPWAEARDLAVDLISRIDVKSIPAREVVAEARYDIERGARVVAKTERRRAIYLEDLEPILWAAAYQMEMCPPGTDRTYGDVLLDALRKKDEQGNE